MMRWPSRSPAVWLRFAIFASIVLVAYFFLSRHDERKVNFPTLPANSNPDTDFCDTLPPGQNVVVAVKTGATEAADKIPGQVQAMLRCAKNVFFFSDLEQDLGKLHLYDSLDNVSSSVVESNIDFEFYQKQLQLWGDKHNIDSVKGAKNPEKPENLAAWTLDKYKNIHIVEKTWALKPNMDWYLFIDADTYVLWPNMLRWLDSLDPNKRYYSGSEVSISGTRFAHGGSGIIMSKAAVAQLAVKHKGTANKWDFKTKEYCCGDLMLGMALKEFGTELQDSWPSVSGETPATMPFGPGTPEYWCRPALTMHHLTLKDMKDLADYETIRKYPGPLTHAELFQDYIMKFMVPYRENWDNLAADPGEFSRTGGVFVEATEFAECVKACEERPDCFQYSHHGNKCYIGMSVRLGYEKKPNGEGMWQSGWNTTRLAEWASNQPKCDQIQFPRQS